MRIPLEEDGLEWTHAEGAREFSGLLKLHGRPNKRDKIRGDLEVTVLVGEEDSGEGYAV